jgi:hypothetical protein
MRNVPWRRLVRRIVTGHVWLLSMLGWSLRASAIDVSPSPDHVKIALERGKSAASARLPPDRLYAWFGSPRDLEPKGFLMTKVVGLVVMSAHFALRGETPTEQDIHQILDDPLMLVSAVIFGNRPDFAIDSYMLMFQADRTIKPVKVRFDGRAARTSVWPQQPAFQAKVVASFRYADFDPREKTRLSVFPPAGGEVSFDLDFAAIE